MAHDSDTESEPESSQMQWNASNVNTSVHVEEYNQASDGLHVKCSAESARAAMESLRCIDMRYVRRVCLDYDDLEFVLIRDHSLG
jgi:hypothetical protein